MKKKILIEQVVTIDRNKELSLLNQGKLNTTFSGTAAEILSVGSNGLPSAVVMGRGTTGGRIYTYGVPFKGKSGTQYWVVYDGAYILRGNNGEYNYYFKDGKPSYAGNWPNQNMGDVYQPILDSMGLKSTQDIYGKLQQYKTTFQKIIDQGANGNFFNEFNNILEFFYPNDETKRLKPNPPNTTFFDIVDTEELQSKYNPVDVTRYGLTSKSTIYLPKYAQGDVITPTFDKVDKNNCAAKLKDYFVTGINQMNGSDLGLQGASLNQYKSLIVNCYNKGMYESGTYSGISKSDVDLQTKKQDDPFAPKKRSFIAKLFGGKDRPNKVLTFPEIKRILDNSSIYDLGNIDINRKSAYKESTMKLDKIIKEQLLETSENKKRLLQESKIVDVRFKMIVESANTKTKKGVDEIYVNLLSEMIYLHNQGFDNKVIAESAEGVFGVLSSLFGKSSGSIVDTFKEKGVNWIMEKLGLEGNGYLKNFLITTLGNTNLADVPKLFTDCTFLTKKMAESVPEAYLRKLEYDKGMGNGFMDVVRNGLYDVIRNSDFAQKLETNLATVICPLVDKMSGKFTEKLENMKTNLA